MSSVWDSLVDATLNRYQDQPEDTKVSVPADVPDVVPPQVVSQVVDAVKKAFTQQLTRDRVVAAVVIFVVVYLLSSPNAFKRSNILAESFDVNTTGLGGPTFEGRVMHGILIAAIIFSVLRVRGAAVQKLDTRFLKDQVSQAAANTLKTLE